MSTSLYPFPDALYRRHRQYDRVFLDYGHFRNNSDAVAHRTTAFRMAAFSFHYHNVLSFFGNQPFVLHRGRPVQPVAGKHPDPWHGNRTYGFYFRWCHFPLSIYPRWFVEIAQWTPFYSVYYLSIKLVYDFSWANLAQAVLLNTFWITLIVGFIVFAYGKLIKR